MTSSTVQSHRMFTLDGNSAMAYALIETQHKMLRHPTCL